MRLSEHFFGAPICKCNLNYTLAWFFLLLGYSFVISIVLVNPLELKYGEDKNVIQFILCIAGCFLVSIFSRCMCYKKQEEEEYILTADNPYYNERV
jgi:hypothetical protein